MESTPNHENTVNPTISTKQKTFKRLTINKRLIASFIFVLLILIALGISFIVFKKDKSENNKTEGNNTEQQSYIVPYPESYPLNLSPCPSTSNNEDLQNLTSTDEYLSEIINFDGTEYPELDNFYFSDLIVTCDNKFVVTGSAYPAGVDPLRSNYFLILIRFDEDGSIDTSFGNSGLITFKKNGVDVRGQEIKEDVANNTYVILGNINYRTTLWRFNTDGNLDMSFNKQGYFEDTNTFGPSNLVVDYLNDKYVYYSRNSDASYITRLNKDGTYDLNFAEMGKYAPGSKILMSIRDGYLLQDPPSISFAAGQEKLDFSGVKDEVVTKIIRESILNIVDEGNNTVCSIYNSISSKLILICESYFHLVGEPSYNRYIYFAILNTDGTINNVWYDKNNKFSIQSLTNFVRSDISNMIELKSGRFVFLITGNTEERNNASRITEIWAIENGTIFKTKISIADKTSLYPTKLISHDEKVYLFSINTNSSLINDKNDNPGAQYLGHSSFDLQEVHL